jgi:alkylated DNA repair dioxygenase AlkB
MGNKQDIIGASFKNTADEPTAGLPGSNTRPTRPASPFNADFDGDEYPSIAARGTSSTVEQKNLTDEPKPPVSPPETPVAKSTYLNKLEWVTPAGAPRGFSIAYNAISEDQELALIQWLDTVGKWEHITGLREDAAGRRVQHQGYIYGYKTRAVTKCDPLTGPIAAVAKELAAAGAMPEPTQVIVNEYSASQHIAPHTDAKVFGDTICGLSLGEGTSMTFRSSTSPETEICLPARSLMRMTGYARHACTHGIARSSTYLGPDGERVAKGAKYRRISVTYRTV